MKYNLSRFVSCDLDSMEACCYWVFPFLGFALWSFHMSLPVY